MRKPLGKPAFMSRIPATATANSSNLAAGNEPRRIGLLIQRIRRERHLRLEDLAQRAGYTKGFLSKIENGRANPPIATLLRVAGALGIDAAELLGGAGAGEAADPQGSVHVAAAERLKINHASAGPGYDYWSLAAPRRNKAMEPFLLTVRPGEVDPAKRFEHPGEEFIHVLQGRTEYVVGDEKFVLGPGDSLYFDSTRPHAPLPLGGPVTFLAVFYNPPRLQPLAAAPASPPPRKKPAHRK